MFYELDVQFELDALPTLMFFKKGDVKGAIYEGANDPAKIAEFVNEGMGRSPVRTKVNNMYHFFNNQETLMIEIVKLCYIL